MKKLLLSIMLIMASFVMFAQGTYKEVVYLKNGSIIKGVVLEQVPNESIKIQTADGSIFVYPMSEVEKIAKEIIEPEKTVTQPTPAMVNAGRMERDGRNLELDGRELSDEEVLALVGPENYETYLGAKRQIGVGKAFTAVFWVSLGLTVATAFVAGVNNDYDMLLAAYAIGLVSDVSLPMMCIFKGIGKGRMNWVANEYNKGNRTVMSYSIAPSVMKVQDNTGIGLTFSLNF